MSYEHIVVNQTDGIVTLTLNHPETLNAMSEEMGEEITTVVREVNQNKTARVLIVTGAGRAFCAGGSKSGLQNRTTGTGRREPPKAFYERFLTLRQVEIPTIAAINGPAVGAGFCIALACDLRVIASTAKVGLNFTRIGIHPGMAGTYTTPLLVGMARACEMIFTGRLYSGDEAFAMGLANRVVPAEQVLEAALLLAHDICGSAPIAVRLAKKALYHNDAARLDAAIELESEYQAFTWTTEDSKEGIAAMVEKRKPLFKGQ